tara:strand:+ start:141 stop:788 length:648 start_codon:yes stop_codon:yes gene_type:complete
MSKILKELISKWPLLHILIKKLILKYQQLGSIIKWNNLKNSNEIKLEVGSGPKIGKNGWTTIDIRFADINWDLKKGIPLPDSCVSKIYSSHLLEHIPYNELLIFLNECHRVIKSDGEFLVAVPNFKHYIDAYIDGKNFKDKDTWYQPALVDTGSNMDQLNYMIYMKDQHKYMFDEENLLNILRKAGFSQAKLRDFNSTLDLKERDYESIYAVAFK